MHEKISLAYLEAGSALAIYFIFATILVSALRVPKVSFSFIYLYLNGLLVLLPVTLVSLGIAETPLGLKLPDRAYENFYFAFFSSIAAVIALGAGFHIGSSNTLVLEPRFKLSGLYAIYFIALCVTAFLLLLTDLIIYSPLFEFLNSGSLADGLYYRAQARASSDHGMALNLDWVLAPALTVLLAAVISRRGRDGVGRRYWLLLCVIIFSLVLVKANRLGRDDIAWTLMFIMLSGSYGANRISAKVIFYVVSLLVTGFVLFSAHIDSFSTFSSSFFGRMFSQTSYSVFQWDYIALDVLSGSEVNPSKQVYTDIFGREGGSTAGYAALHIVAAHGIFGSLFYFFGLFSFGLLESMFVRNKSARRPSVEAAGLIILSAFLIPALFNITGFFSLKYIFSTSGWVFVMMYLSLFKTVCSNTLQSKGALIRRSVNYE